VADVDLDVGREKKALRQRELDAGHGEQGGRIGVNIVPVTSIDLLVACEPGSGPRSL